MSIQTIAKKYRKPEYEILSLFYTRWSPRAMTKEKLSKEEIMSLFEAARWAPSSYNNQPWRFVIALSSLDKQKFMNFLGEFNQNWCENASALVVVLSKKTFEHNGKPSITHSFDTGAAWMSFALEGARRGLVIHGMEGFDYDQVRKELNIPEDYQVEMMLAIGKLGKKEDLSEQLAKQEIPSQRKALSDIISFGEFKWK